MADEKKNLSKEEAAAAKAAAKAAEKERKERIKRNKPKADENRPNIFVRILNAIKRFFKDFRGTCKKVIWPDGKTVLKSSLVVIVVTLIVGVGVWLVDWGLSAAVRGASSAIAGIGEETEPEELDEVVTEVATAAFEDVTADSPLAVEEGTTAE